MVAEGGIFGGKERTCMGGKKTRDGKEAEKWAKHMSPWYKYMDVTMKPIIFYNEYKQKFHKKTILFAYIKLYIVTVILMVPFVCANCPSPSPAPFPLLLIPYLFPTSLSTFRLFFYVCNPGIFIIFVYRSVGTLPMSTSGSLNEKWTT